MPPFYVTNNTDEPLEIEGVNIPNDGEERVIHLSPAGAATCVNEGCAMRRQTSEDAIRARGG